MMIEENRQGLNKDAEDFVVPQAYQKMPDCFISQDDWNWWCYQESIANKNSESRRKRREGTYNFAYCKDCWKEYQDKMICEGRCSHPNKKLKTEQEVRDQSNDDDWETKECVTCKTVKDILDFEHIYPKEGRVIVRHECRKCYNIKKRRKNGLTSTDYRARKQDLDVL